MSTASLGDTPDELFDVRNALYIGNYASCVNEAQRVKPSTEEGKDECAALMYRAMVAQGKYAVVKGEIKESSPSELQSIKLLATYLHKKADREAVLEKVKKQQDDSISMSNPTVAHLAGAIFAAAGNYEDALRCLKQAETLENEAMVVQLYLQMHRVDLADKELQKLQSMDDDSTLTQLASGWINLAKGGDKLKDAFYTFHELAEKFGTTPMLLNGQAATMIQQGNYEEAQGTLQEALEKNSNDPETLINLVGVCQYLGKPVEAAQRYVNQLKDEFPEHPFVVSLLEKEELFQQSAAQFAA